MNDIKTSLFHIYRYIFKPITFAEYENSLDEKSKRKLLLELSLYSYVISLFIDLTFRVICLYFFKVPFNWTDILNVAFGIAAGIAAGIIFGIITVIVFFIFYFKVFYVFPHLILYFRARFSYYSDEDVFSLFKKSPVYWDEVIICPLPFLENFLVMLTEADRDKGLSAIAFVSSKRPTQRKAAFNARLQITIEDLSKLKSIEEISDVSKKLSFLSSVESFLPKEFNKTLRGVDDLSIDARNYLNSSSDFNRLKNLNNLESDILELKKSLISTKGPVKVRFLYLIKKWSQIVEKEKNAK